MTGSVWHWFEFYLSDRIQAVCLDGTMSDTLSVCSGVPQGSILGPLLFIIYVNDIPDHVCFSSIYLFADDTKILSPISSPSDCLSVQADLDAISDWSKLWFLPFNSAKCKVMHIHAGSSSTSPAMNHTYKIYDSVIDSAVQHKDLGITLSSDLSWSHHYRAIVSSALKFFHLIRRQIASNHSVSLKLSLYITLIRSKLTYCSQIWRPRLVKDIKFIESVQRKGSKFILNDFSSNYKDRLIALDLLPLMYWFNLNI